MGVWLEPLFATGKLSENEVALGTDKCRVFARFSRPEDFFCVKPAPDSISRSPKILNAFEKNAKVFVACTRSQEEL